MILFQRVRRIGKGDTGMKGLSIGLRLRRCEMEFHTNPNDTVPLQYRWFHNVLTLGTIHCYLQVVTLLIKCAITL